MSSPIMTPLRQFLPTSRARVLIVQHDPEETLALGSRLTALGYRVTPLATSAEEALRQVEAHRPDLVLLDLRLDVGETARLLRDRFQLPLLYLTASAQQQPTAQVSTTESCGFVHLPCEDAELALAIEATLAMHLAARRQHEQRLFEARRMETIGRLAGGIAHEFNNLLTVINGYTSLVLHALPPEESLREMLEHVARAGDRAASLTHQLLAYGRRQMLHFEVLDLNDLLVRSQKMVQGILGDAVELVLRPGPHLDRVKVDRVQTEQVILQLASNARDAMPNGGRLTLETSNVQLAGIQLDDEPEPRSGPAVLLSVTDTGCGMDATTRAHLFEPFFTTKDVGKGSGLGLATVHGVLRQSGGHVEVESEPSLGTRVLLYFPALREVLDQPAPLAPTSAEGNKP
jgi:signal transduction histidine kinase